MGRTLRTAGGISGGHVRSNWGSGQRGGILAPGLAVPGACVGGGTCRGTGTSFAAATVSGVAALLMSLDMQRGAAPSGSRARRTLIETCDPCPADIAEICGPYLSGRLNLARALDRILGPPTIDPASEDKVTTADATREDPLPRPDLAQIEFGGPARLDAGLPGLSPAHEGCACGGKCNGGAGCACGGGVAKAPAKPQLVYAIGRLGISFISQARRDAIWRRINGTVAAPRTDLDLKPIGNEALRDLFRAEPWHAQSVIWTLSRTEVPMYAIVPSGAYAAETYAWLVEEWSDQQVQFISLPGVVGGQVTLYDGMTVDAAIPDLRGMFSWETTRYVEALTRQLVAPAPAAEPPRRGARARDAEDPDGGAGGGGDGVVAQRIDRFLRKIYFRIRNRGLSPEERALNAAATNAFNFSNIIEQAGSEGLAFRDVSVERSPLNRPGSEYYDVLLTFFDPGERMKVAPLVARFTVDVSDTVPVVVGEPVSWYEY